MLSYFLLFTFIFKYYRVTSGTTWEQIHPIGQKKIITFLPNKQNGVAIFRINYQIILVSSYDSQYYTPYFGFLRN